MFTITIAGDKEVINRMRARRDKLLPAVEKEMRKQAIDLVAYIQRRKLQSQPLHHRSGRLQGSIKQQVTRTSDLIKAKVYTNVEYARIHEYGGHTPPHVIEPKKAKALAFTVGGKQIFAKRVNHPGSKMPERSFMRSSLAENEQKIKDGLTKAVSGVMRAP